jgi:hypothetical protein
MRKSIEDQINDYRINQNKKVCALCNDYKKIEVDHYEPKFRYIVSNFLKENPEFEKIELEDDLNFGGSKFKSDLLVDKWNEYHKKTATYRLLCKACNLRNK